MIMICTNLGVINVKFRNFWVEKTDIMVNIDFWGFI